MSEKTKYSQFAKKHPRLHTALTLLSFFLPMIILTVVLILADMPEGADVLAVYAIFGSMVLGVGLALFVGTNFDSEVFMRLTVYPIAIGVGLIAVPLALTYGGAGFDGGLFEYQLLVFISVLLFALFYSIQREALLDCAARKSGITVKGMKKRLHGFIESLWLGPIHEEYGLGLPSHLNRVFTVVLALTFVCNIFLPLSKAIAVVVLPLGLLTAATSIALELLLIVTSLKNGKRYFESGHKRRLISSLPWFSEIMVLASDGLIIYLMIRTFLQMG